MRTIVTGGSGFIGSTLCAALRAAGREPVSVSLRSAEPRFDGAQAIVHLAGIAHRAGVDAAELERVNVSLEGYTATVFGPSGKNAHERMRTAVEELRDKLDSDEISDAA